MSNRNWMTVVYVLLQLAWTGYSALCWLGAAFPDYADDEIFNQMKSLEIGVVWWRWFAVSLLLGIAFKFFRRSADV